MAAAGADGSEARLDGTLRPDDRRGKEVRRASARAGKGSEAGVEIFTKNLFHPYRFDAALSQNCAVLQPKIFRP